MRSTLDIQVHSGFFWQGAVARSFLVFERFKCCKIQRSLVSERVKCCNIQHLLVWERFNETPHNKWGGGYDSYFGGLTAKIRSVGGYAS